MEDKTFILLLVCLLGMICLAGAGYMWPLGNDEGSTYRVIEVTQRSLENVLLILAGVKGAVTAQKLAQGASTTTTTTIEPTAATVKVEGSNNA